MVNGIRNNLTGFVMILVLVLTLPVVVSATGWQWMAPQQVYGLIKEGSGLWLVDLRNEASFAEGHIEGAINIPAGLLATKRIPKGKIIVLADDSLGLRKGRESAELLLKKGNERVYLLEGGVISWQGEGLPVAGKGSARKFRGVMLDDIGWALENRIHLRIFDLRDKRESSQSPVTHAQAVEGKTLAEQLDKVKEMVGRGAKKGIAAKLEKQATAILVFPTAIDPQTVLERSFRGVSGDVRYLEGGYVAWAAKPDKKGMGSQGACPTCPSRETGGKR